MHRRIAVLLAALVVLAACSRTELVYRHADWLVYRWVDGLLDARGQQQDNWRSLLQDVHDAHRRELLPEVVVLLDRLSRRSDDGLTRMELDCLLRATERLVASHARLLVSAAVDVLDGITPAQVDHLEEALTERHAEYRGDYLQPDPAERHAARVERYTERIERWTGDLDTGQMRLVEAAVRGMPDTAADWLQYREQQQARLLAMLRGGADREALRAFLSRWWVDMEDRDVGLIDAGERLRDGWLGLLAELDTTFGADQREDLVRRIDGLRDDLAGEIGEGFEIASVTVPEGCARSL